MSAKMGNNNRAERTSNAGLPLGRMVATPGALAAFERMNQSPAHFLARHATGDWRDVSPEDWNENELSLRHGYRILTAYHLLDHTKIWIITEADRSATTILLPEEY